MDGKTAQRGGILPPRCAVYKDMASAFESGILSHKMTTFLILLRHWFLLYFCPTFWSLLLIRHRPINARIFFKKIL